jgi:hypothetical protein
MSLIGNENKCHQNGKPKEIKEIETHKNDF